MQIYFGDQFFIRYALQVLSHQFTSSYITIISIYKVFLLEFGEKNHWIWQKAS